MLNNEENDIKIKEKNDKTQTSKRNIIETTNNELLDNKMKVNKLTKKEETIKIDDYILNHLDFKKAIELDKRGLLQIYFSILKREHIILFTFFSWKDYNLFYIKFPKLFFIISTIMAMNVFFFFDNSIHQLYLAQGKYNFGLLLPQIIYSIMITYFTEVIINFLTMTDKYIYNVKDLENNEANKCIAMNSLKCIQKKLKAFFICILIVMIFYWYLITSFCAVYENTQTVYLINFLLSFIIYLIYPFIIYIITSSIRVCSLKKKSSFIYKLSSIIPIF